MNISCVFEVRVADFGPISLIMTLVCPKVF